MSVIVNINHETGDLSQYTSTVTDGGDLSVTAGAALAGTSYGLSALIDDTNNLYAYKDITASTTGVLSVRAYIDPNSLTMATNDEFEFLSLANNAGFTYVAAIVFRKNADGYYVRARIINDANGSSYTNAYAVSDAPHYVEIKLIRATNSTSSDGSLQLWIDGVDKQTLSGIDNYDKFFQLARVVLGTYNLDAGTSGTFYLDELVVNDDGGLIGPVVAAAGIPRHFDYYARARSV